MTFKLGLHYNFRTTVAIFYPFFLLHLVPLIKSIKCNVVLSFIVLSWSNSCTFLNLSTHLEIENEVTEGWRAISAPHLQIEKEIKKQT